MSVKEKITEMERKDRESAREAETARVEAQRQENQRMVLEEAEKNVRYQAGIHDAKSKQIRLFKQLERSGLVAIVMEATGRHFFAPKMPPPKKENGSVDFSQVKWPSKEVFREAFRDHGWKVEVEVPTLSANDIWDTDIHMKLSQVHYGIVCGRQSRPVDSIDRVTIDFNDKKHLSIKGREVTFEDGVKIQNSAAQTELLEMALARAMHQPETERPKSRTRIYPPGRFGRGMVIGG